MMESIYCGKQAFDFKNGVPAGLSVQLVSENDGVSVYEFVLDAPEETGGISFILRYPMQGILSVYSPTMVRDRSVHQWLGGSTAVSNFYFGAPVLAALKDGNRNLSTLALSDAVNDCSIRFYVNDFEEKETVEFYVTLLTGVIKKKQYCVQLRVDTRDIPLEYVMKDVSAWWGAFYPDRPALPEGAEDPLYSSWYNFHQHPTQDKLLEELQVAAQIGFKTVILDDGWQIAGHGTGDYRMCGDWEVSKDKFYDFRRFVEDVHGLGMKIMLWFSLPFVGLDHPYYEKFKDNMLYYREGALMCGILDPRYASVREHMIGILCRYVQKFGLDGFKLDFLDAIAMMPETPPANDDMDEPDLSQAIIRLLTDAQTRLQAIHPSLLIEYRQNYVGPAINRFGHMLRVCDCAFESQTNRIGIADLRLLHYNVAVHSDMLYWAKSETPENCARQLFNTLFAVPQISVLLANSTEEQRRVIRYYLQYWMENRDVLLHGEFHPGAMDFLYPTLEAATTSRRVVACYLPGCVKLDERALHVFNATAEEGLLLDNTNGAARSGVIVNCFGERMDFMVPANAITRCPIPIGGHIELL